MKNGLFRPVFYSLVIHGSVLLLFVNLGSLLKTKLWGGGANPSPYVMVELAPFSPPSSSQGKEAEKKGPGLSVSSPVKKNSQKEAPASSPASGGEGTSPTPALGKGGGVDAASGGDPGVLKLIQQKIVRAQRYPSQARRDGTEGEVTLRFGLGPDGLVKEAGLVTSSGFAILDEEALATLGRAAPYPFYPGLIRITLKYRLR